MPGYLEKAIQLPWREAGPPNHFADKEISDQQVVNTELSLSETALLRERPCLHLTC